MSMTDLDKNKSGDNTKIQILTMENRLELMDSKVNNKLDRLFEKQEEFCERMEDTQKMSAAQFTKLETKVDERFTKIDDTLDQFHSALYDPEKGTFARLKNVENIAIPAKESRNKIMWIIVGTFLTMATTATVGIILNNLLNTPIK